MDPRDRLSILANHVVPAAAEQQHPFEQTQLFLNHTSGKDAAARMEELMEQGEPYAIPLPETLRPDRPWHVYRCVFAFIAMFVSVSNEKTVLCAAGVWRPPANSSARSLLQMTTCLLCMTTGRQQFHASHTYA